jgi:alkylation response protein AidB-like acyl-CoA dehydrogenase
MELEFTAEQDELRDSVRTVLSKESPISLARSIVEGTGDDDRLWATMVELGWPALTVPEASGGIGLGAVEAGILAEELGRVVAPSPLLPTVTQFTPVVRALGSPEQQARFLGAVALGELRGTLAVANEHGSVDPESDATVATKRGDGVVINGTNRYVMAGDEVDEVAVVVQFDDGVGAVVVPASAATSSVVNTLDRTRRLTTMVFDDVAVDADRVLVSRDVSALSRAIDEATVALALEMVGTAQSIFDVTLEYAKQREQFGVPIGSFQAVKHKFADMAISLERARSLAYFAMLTLAEDDERAARSTSAAKIAAGDCQRLLGQEGIQLHGGIGYTWEHDMHLYVKRCKEGEPLFGTSNWHRARLATLLGV